MSLMLDEIAQQPQALAQTISAERDKVAQLGRFLKTRDIHVIVLVARGSSDNAALFGRYLLEVATGIPVSLAAPSVYTLYGAQMDLRHALVIGVSQSGAGEDINFVLDAARKSGAYTVGITNDGNSALAHTAHETLLTHGGPELSVAATRTYTGQLLLFNMLAHALAQDQKMFVCDAIPEFTAQALLLDAEIQALVQRYVFMENCVVVGRGMIYCNAYELALKLMETCYVVAERFSSADFLHGPVALVERHFPVIMFAPSGATQPGVLQVLERLRELRADVLTITGNETVANLSSRSLRMPGGIGELLCAVPYIVPAQLFAAHLAAAKGLDADAPRSLSKVTRTL